MSKYSFSNPKLFMMKLYAVQRIELVHFLHFFAAIILLTSRDNSMRGNVRKATRLPEQVVTVTMTNSHQKPRIILNHYLCYLQKTQTSAVYCLGFLKFVFFEKATKFDEISILLLTKKLMFFISRYSFEHLSGSQSWNFIH